MAAAIAGYNGAKGIIDNCSTTETVTIASTTAISGRYGGICARNSGSSDIPANIATIQNCQNAALIKVDIIKNDGNKCSLYKDYIIEKMELGNFQK